MKLRSLLALGIVLLFGTVACAQDYAKVEVPLYYSYMRFNPENSGILSGFSLNGGGGGAAIYVNHWLGFEAEFSGYGSSSRTFIFPATANSPCPIGCTVKASGALLLVVPSVIVAANVTLYCPAVKPSTLGWM